MQFNSSKKKPLNNEFNEKKFSQKIINDRRKSIVIEDEKHFNGVVYKHCVNYYGVPPIGKIDLEQSQELIEERLKILNVFDECKGGFNLSNYKHIITLIEAKLQTINKNMFNGSIGKATNNIEVTNQRRRDHISHFLLRLYFAKNENLKQWFIDREVDLFRLRLMTEDTINTIDKFIEINNLPYKSLSNESFVKLDKHIRDWFITTKHDQTPLIFCLPFESALDLVRTRRCYLHNGNAFIKKYDMIVIIVGQFRIELSQALARLSQRLSSIDEERRLLPQINQAYQKIIKEKKKQIQPTTNNWSISRDMIDNLAEQSFPPCMQSIHQKLRENHHLKHYGRLHYGLFLKSIGLSLDEALNFFREEFTQKVTPEKFQREHAYNIRYNYGKEGKKVSLSAYSCSKIINEHPPAPGDSHGCPFRHYDESNLEKLMKKLSVDQQTINEIQCSVKEKNYSLACTKYFNYKHPCNQLNEENMIYHPNQFYRESRRTYRTQINDLNQEIKETEQFNETNDQQSENIEFDEETDKQINEAIDFNIANNDENENENVQMEIEQNLVDEQDLNTENCE